MAAEFDIKQGVDLKDCFPIPADNIENSYVIASYMLPDGCHRHSQDVFLFKSHMLIKDGCDKAKVCESSEKLFFLNYILRREDKTLKRGVCIRSMAIASKSIQ